LRAKRGQQYVEQMTIDRFHVAVDIAVRMNDRIDLRKQCRPPLRQCDIAGDRRGAACAELCRRLVRSRQGEQFVPARGEFPYHR